MGRSHHNPSYYSDNIHIKIAKIILKEVSSFRENLRKKVYSINCRYKPELTLPLTAAHDEHEPAALHEIVVCEPRFVPLLAVKRSALYVLVHV